MSDDAKILAGRYEVGDLIGRGGMAEVHIGYDTRLGRTVAIKILRADLARDPSFQTRFRREAQAAAGLNHPSIVAVYDTGEDSVVGASGMPQAVPFIVMEYVEGHTVRDILKGDVAAPIDEAVEIVAGVLAALDYSHHAGLVHRDIKPANVMLTPTGAVKVMDFGIARALADAGQSMTQTQAVVGTAQYLSPEQARGESVDTRSDLYSTGCLLFELLTGRPPFIGDSPVSVAYQHVREPAPRPSQFASDVPEALDKIVLRALAKDPNERYSSAQAFASDLNAFRAGEPVDPSTGAIAVGAIGAAALGGAALGAAMSGDAAREEAASQPTQAMPVVPETAPTAVMPSQEAQAAPWAAVVGADQAGSIPPTGPATATMELDPDDEEEERKRKLRQYWLLGAAAAAVIAIVVAIFLFTQTGDEPTASPSAVPIPDLVGMTEVEATAALTRLGLTGTFVPEASDTVEKDLVTRSDPPFGEEIAAGSNITVYLSAGPSVVTIPDVRDQDELAATQALEALDLVVVREEQDDPEVEKGFATGTDPVANTQVAPGSQVTLFIASGQVDLPDVVGETEDSARAQLDALGLTTTTTRQETANATEGTVIEQSPGPGKVDVGSSVELTVATKPTTATVPDVTGLSQADAEDELQDAGFKVTVQQQASDTVPAGIVIAQSPEEGIKLGLNQPVRIWVSTGPETEPTAEAAP
jgi:beta-lactam-binding protein with PASTA domain